MNTQLQPIIARLKERPAQPLSPKQIWDQALESAIGSLVGPLGPLTGSLIGPLIGPLSPSGMPSDPEAVALMAALHLLNDSLDKSHAYAQQIENDSTGAYWHGIMHRMEGDYANAKYWFRRSGRHPAMEMTERRISIHLKDGFDPESMPHNSIQEKLRRFRDHSSWNCGEFTDLVELQESGSGSAETRHLLERLQQIEISALFDHTYEAFTHK